MIASQLTRRDFFELPTVCIGGTLRHSPDTCPDALHGSQLHRRARRLTSAAREADLSDISNAN